MKIFFAKLLVPQLDHVRFDQHQLEGMVLRRLLTQLRDEVEKKKRPFVDWSTWSLFRQEEVVRYATSYTASVHVTFDHDPLVEIVKEALEAQNEGL